MKPRLHQLQTPRSRAAALARAHATPTTVSTRIAALVPQQPIQARDMAGRPWWQHECGAAWPVNQPDQCLSCQSPGLWRPLLVGGDPAPALREPRTWPKLDIAPMDLKAFKGASGMVYRPKREGSEYFVAEADRSPTPAAKRLSTWQELDGPLTEVFDDQG